MTIPLDLGWLQANPLPEQKARTDKDDRGRVLVAGGAESVPGALRLTGEAALRSGAGRLQLATVERAALALGIAMPEAAVYPLAANQAGELGARAGAALCAHLESCDTLVLGPGTGHAAAARAILAAVLAAPPPNLSILLDAGMLMAAPALADAIRGLEGRAVLTPHPGEMMRLMACEAARIDDDPVGLAAEAATRFAATVLLKGPETYVANPDGSVLRYAGGGPGLGTGGSGDVLAGTIGGLMARGAPPPIAAAWGVWLHGEAGRRLAASVAPIGFLARELPAQIPALIASVQR